MKTLLTAICFTVCSSCFGQIDLYDLVPAPSVRDSLKVKFMVGSEMSLQDFLPEHDTVPIIMLYSDTAHVYSLKGVGMPYSIEPIKYDTMAHYKMEWTLWMPGFEVFEKKNSDRFWYWRSIGYLNENKERLTENIVVWQTLKRKIKK